MNEIDRHIQTNINIQEKSNLIWNNAEILRGLYKPHEYGEVILPMTVIKRFHDSLSSNNIQSISKFSIQIHKQRC